MSRNETEGATNTAIGRRAAVYPLAPQVSFLAWRSSRLRPESREQWSTQAAAGIVFVFGFGPFSARSSCLASPPSSAAAALLSEPSEGEWTMRPAARSWLVGWGRVVSCLNEPCSAHATMIALTRADGLRPWTMVLP
jgi:hypothetical protein